MTYLIYIGIAITLIGWLMLAWFAAKQIKTEKEYALAPQKWEAAKQSYIKKRSLSRVIIILGIILLLVSLTL